MLDRALTQRELARRWRCRVGFVRAQIKSGKLAAIEINGRVRVLPEAVHQAEQGLLAVKPKTRPKARRESISREVRELLGI